MLYHTFPLEAAGDAAEVFRAPFYLLVNLAIGGSWGGPLDDGVLPQRFLVDWVRVSERVDGAANADDLR